MADPFTRALYQALVGSDNVRYRQIPTAAAGIAVADDAAWDQIVASTIILTEHWIAAENIGGTAAAMADSEEVVAHGTGGADGATVAPAATIIETDVIYHSVTAVGEYFVPPYYLPVPVRVPASTRHAASISTSATGGFAISFGFTEILNLGA